MTSTASGFRVVLAFGLSSAVTYLRKLQEADPRVFYEAAGAATTPYAF